MARRQRRFLLVACALLGIGSVARAEECRTIEFGPKRLACYDKEAEFYNELQQMIAVELRLAEHAASECGFIIDADRFKMRLLAADLTWRGIFGGKPFSPEDRRRIGDDAQFGRGDAYCEKAWSTYGPDISEHSPDRFLYRCKSKESCSPASLPPKP